MLPSQCDRCNAAFSIHHALECKKGGLIIIRHNEIQDELVDLASKTISPSAVCDEPNIHACRTNERESPEDGRISQLNALPQQRQRWRFDSRSLEWGDGLHSRCQDDRSRLCEVQQIQEPRQSVSRPRTREKEEVFWALPRTMTIFFSFCGTNGWSLWQRGKEANIVLKRLTLMLTEKWGKPYSEVCGYVNARMSIAIVCATHLCVRGSHIPTSTMSQSLPQWED
jgi:hypothetical protein